MTCKISKFCESRVVIFLLLPVRSTTGSIQAISEVIFHDGVFRLLNGINTSDAQLVNNLFLLFFYAAIFAFARVQYLQFLPEAFL